MTSTPRSTVERRDVLAGVTDNIGTIELNRPAALNALTTEMVRDIQAALTDWQAHPLTAVLITSAHPEAFCAGGDIRAVRANVLAGEFDCNTQFFDTEYRLNLHLSRYRTPVIALIDGICMGGGLGLSVHGAFRVVTENAVLAMPETSLGFFPDIGASHFLSRLAGGLGAYIGLTGCRLTAADALYSGLATHCVGSAELAQVPARLADSPGTPVHQVLAGLQQELPQDSDLQRHRSAVDRCFTATTVDQVRARLRAEGSSWAEATLDTLDRRSPQSLALTLTLLGWGRQLDLADCLAMELAAAEAVTRTPDFAEGVRAVLVDKDQQPRWVAHSPFEFRPR
ncbi:enoyl-CoA hydratase/isomerase family protein [Mycobacterium sp. NPDC003323]